MMYISWKTREKAHEAGAFLEESLGLGSGYLGDLVEHGSGQSYAVRGTLSLDDEHSVRIGKSEHQWGWVVPLELTEWVLRLPSSYLCDARITMVSGGF